MTSSIQAKRLFLKIAHAFYLKKLERREKIKHLDSVEEELILAEKLMDSLAEQKSVDIHILIKVNTKIEKLREKIHVLQGKKSEAEIMFY